MLATTRDLRRVGSRLELVERQAGEANATIRLLIRLLAEGAARESAMRARLRVAETEIAALRELVLARQIDAGEGVRIEVVG